MEALVVLALLVLFIPSKSLFETPEATTRRQDWQCRQFQLELQHRRERLDKAYRWERDWRAYRRDRLDAEYQRQRNERKYRS